MFVSARFQVLFHSPNRGAFHLSLTVLVHYRSSRVFSLGGVDPPASCRVSVLRTTQDTNQQLEVSGTGLSPAMVGHSSAVLLPVVVLCSSYNPTPTFVGLVWATPLSLATTDGIVSFPPGT